MTPTTERQGPPPGRVRRAAMSWSVRRLAPALALLLALLVAGCGSDESGSGSFGTSGAGIFVPPGGGGSAGFVAPGAADFGVFRALVKDGKVPAPSVLDDLGFFAEHKIDFPTADCGQDLCMHGRVGIMGNLITGSTCTIAQIGLNSPLDPSKLERPPLHLVLVLDASGSMSGAPMEALHEGLQRLALEMKTDHPDDLLTLVRYSDAAKVLLQGAKGSDAEALKSAIDAIQPGGATNLYGGLALGYKVAGDATPKGHAARVVLLSDGLANAGLVAAGKARQLARTWAAQGVGLTTIGVGDGFDHELMGSLAESGQGNAYFLDKVEAVREVFVEEARTALFPVAAAITIRVDTGDAWAARGVYGVRDVSHDEGGVTIRIPALYLAHRLSASEPIEGGRRGGGAVIQVELMPLATSFDEPKLQQVGKVQIDWTHIQSGKALTQAETLTLPTLSAATVKEGFFADAGVEKGFVMLNLLVALQMACDLVAAGDAGAAQGALTAIALGVETWLADHPDADIEDDVSWVKKLLANVVALPTNLQTPMVPPPEPWPID